MLIFECKVHAAVRNNVETILQQVCAGKSSAAKSRKDISLLIRQEPQIALTENCALLDIKDVEENQKKLATVLIAAALDTVSQDDKATVILDSIPVDLPIASKQELPWRVWHRITRIAINFNKNQYAGMDALLDKTQADLNAAPMQRESIQGIIWQARGFLAFHRKQLPLATKWANKAQEIYQKSGLGKTMLMGDVYNLYTVIENVKANYAKSAKWAKAEYELRTNLGFGQDPEVLESLASIGTGLDQRGKFTEAEKYMLKALDIIDKNPDGDVDGQLGVFKNLGRLYRDQGQYEKAINLIDRGVTVVERNYGLDSPKLATVLGLRGETNLARGFPRLALQDFERASKIAKQKSEDLGLSAIFILRSGWIATLLNLGELDEAEKQIEEGLQLVKGKSDGDSKNQSQHLLLFRGILRINTKKYAKAETDLKDAETIFQDLRGKNSYYLINIRSLRCVAQVGAKIQVTSCRQLERILNILNDASPIFRVEVYERLAVQAAARANHQLALKYNLLGVAAANSVGSPAVRWPSLFGVATNLRRLGQKDRAIIFGKQALIEIEKIRNGLGKEQSEKFLANKLDVYRTVADWLARDGRLGESIQVLKLLKEEQFSDFITRDAGLVNAFYTDLTPFEKKELARLLPASHLSQPANAQLLDKKDKIGQNRRQAQAEKQEAAMLNSRLQGKSYIGSRVQATAEKKEADVLDQLTRTVPDGVLYVYAIFSEKMTLIFQAKNILRREELNKVQGDALIEIRTTLENMRPDSFPLDKLKTMYNWLGAPIVKAANDAKAHTVLLLTDGDLRAVPFAALYDGKKYMGENFAFVHLVPGGKTMEAKTDKNSKVIKTIQGLGVSNGWSNLAPLKNVDEELCAIVSGIVHGLESGKGKCRTDGHGKGSMVGDAWLNSEFTANRLRELTKVESKPVADILHIATHFRYRPNDMAHAWLLMGDGSQFNLSDMAKLSFEGREIVTLSSCQSGLPASDGLSGIGEEGLNMLVMRRGAHSVLGSLWPVYDVSTSDLMAKFYAHLANHLPVVALQLAQNEVRETRTNDRTWENPWFWAGFYLTQEIDPR
jgi:CHAT domain-containing protein